MKNRTKERGKKALVATAVFMMLIACAFALKPSKSSLPVSSAKSVTSSLSADIPQVSAVNSNVSSAVLQEVSTQKNAVSNEIVDFGKSAISGCSSPSAVAVNPQNVDSIEIIDQLVYSELPSMAVSISPAGMLPENLLEDVKNMFEKIVS